jgi:hypothetical protein
MCTQANVFSAALYYAPMATHVQARDDHAAHACGSAQ